MVIIRRERKDDRDAVREVNRLAFGQDAEADLVDALRQSGAPSISLVADREQQVVGHILFTPLTVHSETGSWKATGLAPMSVLPDFQKQGIGSEMVRSGLEACRMQERNVVFVLGHPAFYPRFGFVPAAPLGLRSEYDVPDDTFLVVELRDGALAGRQGLVRYLPEFSSV